MKYHDALNRRDFIKQASAVVVAGAALASCGTTATHSTSNKVVIWSAGDSGPIKDWHSDPILQAVEKATNTQIEMVKISYDSYNSKLSATVASHKVPDIISCYDTGAFRTIDQWVRDKVIAPFEGDVAAAAPNIVNEYKTDRSLAEVKYNGKIYGQPVYWNHGNGPNAQAVYVRKDLLDSNGMAIPDTFEQFFAYVRAMKQKGLKGVVFGGKVGPGAAFVDPMDAFLGAYGLPKNGWIKVGKDYEYWAVQPRVKDAVLLFRRMVNEGLIENESWELDTQHAEENFESGQYASYIGLSGGHTGRIQSAFETQGKGYHAWVLPAPDAGTGSRGYTAGPQFYGLTFIGNLSDNNPVAAARVLNYLNSPEGLKLTAVGIKGRDYTEDNGVITLLPQRVKDNFPAGAVGDTGAHPLATPIVSWVPQEWQDFALLNGRDQAFKDWYNLMWVNLKKYNVTAYGTLSTTPKWTTFSSTNADLLAQTFLPMVKANSDQDATTLFNNFVQQWHAQGGSDATKEMSDHLLSVYR